MTSSSKQNRQKTQHIEKQKTIVFFKEVLHLRWNDHHIRAYFERLMTQL